MEHSLYVAQPARSFLQSAEWEEVQRRVGRETFRVSGALVIAHPLRIGGEYLYAPHLSYEGRRFDAGLSALARARGSVFAKIDHWGSDAYDGPHAVLGRSIQPAATIVVGLARSEGDILASMHQKTRYNIRLAERKGVSVSPLLGGLGTLYALLDETARREGFRIHPADYYETLRGVSSKDFSTTVFVAHKRGEPLAAALVNFYRPSGIATYLHGGSHADERNAMAPYLLHWEIMKEAKRRGFSAYDLWGVDETRWPGLTRFKQGFGGSAVFHPPTVDVIFDPARYMLYRGAQTLFRRA